MTRTVNSIRSALFARTRLANRRLARTRKLELQSLEQYVMPGDMRGPLAVMATTFADTALMPKVEVPPAPDSTSSETQAPSSPPAATNSWTPTSQADDRAETRPADDETATQNTLSANANNIDAA